MFDLVSTVTKDNLYLHGLLIEGDKEKPAIIHIHGFQGDFFTNEFVMSIAREFKKNNVTFLTVQTRGTGIESELYTTTPSKGKVIGSSFELLEEAYIDIDAWIEFIQKKGYKNIVLEGHSLGTMKIVRYLFEGNNKEDIKKLILLAPFDIIQLAKQSTKGKWEEYLKIAEQKVEEGKGIEIIPNEFLDAKMSYQTYVSHHKKTDFEYMFAFHDKSYKFPILNQIKIPVKVIVGKNDPYFHPSNLKNPEEAINILSKNIKSFEYKLVENAGHIYTNQEEFVADEVFKFINSS